MITILSSTNPALSLARLAVLTAAVLAFAMASVANAQQSFRTAEEAADALVSAAGAGDLVVESDPDEVAARLAAAHAAPALPVQGALPDNLEAYLDAVERDILARALERHRNNRTAAGASLGLSLRQMRYRMARLGVVVTGNDAD